MDHKIRCEALARDLLSVASFGRNLQARSRVRSLERANVRFWHLADIQLVPPARALASLAIFF